MDLEEKKFIEALKRIVKFATQIAEIDENIYMKNKDTFGKMQALGVSCDGLKDAVKYYQKTCEILGRDFLEG